MNIYDEIFDYPCAVCNTIIKVDCYKQGDCPNCGWKNDMMAERNPDRVIYRNYVPYNKAKRLYAEGRPLIPDIDDFMGMLNFYSEVQFEYKGKTYGVIYTSGNNGDTIIEMFDAADDVVGTFKDSRDFIDNAKIDGVHLKDVWDTEVSGADWLQ